jgi:hypothetical protein
LVVVEEQSNVERFAVRARHVLCVTPFKLNTIHAMASHNGALEGRAVTSRARCTVSDSKPTIHGLYARIEAEAARVLATSLSARDLFRLRFLHPPTLPEVLWIDTLLRGARCGEKMQQLKQRPIAAHFGESWGSATQHMPQT